MSLIDARESIVSDGFPRVSGDEPVHVTLEVLRLEFSPRERG